VAESVTRKQPTAGSQVAPGPRLAPLAGGGLCFALLLVSYLGSAAVLGSDRALLRPDAPWGVDVVFRMNLVMMTIVAYTIAVGLAEFRAAPADLRQLRALLDCDDTTFEAAIEAFFPTRLQAMLALGAGSVIAVAMAAVSTNMIVRAGGERIQDVHDVWNVALLILLFALLGLFALWGIRRGGLYSWLSRRHANVSLLDPEPLRLFAARGLRLALFWFVGSGIALLLVVGSQAQAVVFAGIALTTAIGFASLVLPSLGIHQHMREAKAAELARVRGEIETRLDSLRAGGSQAATELPALIAWEARVSQVGEWPLGGGVWIRFGLLVLIPLGSWLGGALVERIVDATLG